jgi:NADPH-dependent curcumin reductase CurA
LYLRARGGPARRRSTGRAAGASIAGIRTIGRQTMTPPTYRRIVLVRRPPGEPAESDFRIEEVPTPQPGPGQVLVRVIYLSLDPYMRGRMRDQASYAAPVGIGEVMTGGTVGEVVASQHPGFKVGDIVEERLGWQEYGLSNGAGLRKIDPSLAPISTANGVLGMPGMTAYFGLFEVGQPKAGETVVVSAASGAVGQVVGQLAKIAGCRAVGIAGGARKCAFVKDTLGLDACIDYKAGGDLAAAVKAACPGGVDVYFDNVGGPVSDAVLANLNFFARVSLCGSISQYNAEAPELGPRLFGTFVGRRVTMRGFIVSDFMPKFGSAMRQMGQWVRSGRIKYKEDIVEGLEKAPRAFIGLLRGENFGKLQVKVGAEPGGR